MANRLEIAFIASPALLLVTANEVGQTFTRHFMPVPLEQPRGVGARGGTLWLPSPHQTPHIPGVGTVPSPVGVGAAGRMGPALRVQPTCLH